jgi:hypothetical protein
VTDRDLFGAYLEATFGDEKSSTTSNSGSSDGGGSSSSSTAAVSHSEIHLRGGQRGRDGNSQPSAAAAQVGIEVGPEIGDFAAQVLQKWSSCRSYFLVDDVISEAAGSSGGEVKLNSNTAVRSKVFAFLLISKEYMYSIGWVWIALKFKCEEGERKIH